MTYPILSIVSRVASSSKATMLIIGVSLGFDLRLIGKRPSDTQSIMVRLGIPEN